ncbi:MAG: glycosyltransferase family 2 protein [Deferribacteres bacterium]|nr:glycosyltransferase family 2 protein [candidate division KSB1 bacterium]MCB9502536.1 glycosyltransferase family 2 protein [Deferribacteres bacterium]
MTLQSHNPLVYCVVLNLNGLSVIEDALESILQMTYANFRILVVDNGSSDGSPIFIRERFPNIELMENEQNLGFGGGNNVGMEYALSKGAEWIFLLNNDIVVDKNLLSELIDVGIKEETTGALGAKIYYFDEPDKIWFAGGNVNFFTGLTTHRQIRKVDTNTNDAVQDSDYITGCALLLRVSVLKEVGLFDEVFFPSYVEDADLSMRIRQAGYKLRYVPKAKLWHKVSSFSGGGLTPLKTELRTAHSLIFFRRYARWYHWLSMPLFIFLGSMVFIFREVLKGNWGLIQALFQGFALGIRKTSSSQGTAA